MSFIVASEVTIKEENLDWMGESDEAELPFSDVSNVEDEDFPEENGISQDTGPAADQCLLCLTVADDDDNLKTCGVYVEDEAAYMSPDDIALCSEVRESGYETASSPWPYVSPDPVSEYDSTEEVFCKAFPWLYPGAFGDINNYRSKPISATDWAQRQLHFEDGRFARDKMWCFFALNYTSRGHRNQTSGHFFVNGFHPDAPETLDDLKKELKNGNSAFLDKITYYSSRVKGSAGYWRAKRVELNTWINYHVSAGNGMPNFFITLSCAEYFWPDVLRLSD